MNQVFFVCAVLGGTIFLAQFLLAIVGLGEHHDVGSDAVDFDHEVGAVEHDASAVDHDVAHESAMSWFLGVLSFRTIVAGLVFFGLAGMAAQSSGAHPAGSLTVATLAGLAAVYAVAWVIRGLARLKADGTVRIESALGQPGIVYLNIPGRNFGRGKVTVTVQNRTMEYDALTTAEELPTGAAVVVVGIVDRETIEVAAAPVGATGLGGSAQGGGV